MYCIVASILFAIVIWLCQTFLGDILWLKIPILILSGLLWFWVFWFFRIPTRTETFDDNLIISPCDGKVVVIEETTETEYFKDRRLQISIFMSPLNVHVNKYPMSGKVMYAKHHAGKYLVAWHPKSSTENERTTIVVKGSKAEILVRQIAGAVARRIVMYSKEGDAAKQNAELGFIKFGSRVDIYVPLGTKIDVQLNQVVRGGESVLATLA